MGADNGVTLQQFPSKAVEAYGETEFARLDRKLAMFRALPEEDRLLLPEFVQRISMMAECVDMNTKLLSAMAQSAEGISASNRPVEGAVAAPVVSEAAATNGDSGGASGSGGAGGAGGAQDDGMAAQEDQKTMLSRGVRRGFALLATDWSAVGAAERARIYAPMVAAVDEAFEEARRAARALQRDAFRVLVPAAGAGRLAWELAHKGFTVEGCETSFSALLVGNFVMNGANGAVNGDEMVEFFPYVHEHSNMRSCASVTRGVRMPDVNPMDMPGSADLAIRAGDFVTAYDGQDNVWDAVVSYLAFDVGEGCLEHVRRVAQILKPGGVWVVVGPTPCVDGAQGDGVHVSGEEFIEMTRKCGFKIMKQKTMKSLYSTDDNSLRTVHIECPFVVAVKVRPIA